MRPELVYSPRVPGVLSAQVDGIEGAAVVCVIEGEPIALTLGSKGVVVTVDFDATSARGLMSVLSASIKHMGLKK